MPYKIILIMLSLSIAESAHAQSMTIFGGSEIAKECYQASTNAAMTTFASDGDVDLCNKAIQHGQLQFNDLIATYVNRGVINAALENYAAAANDYRTALTMNPEVAEAYHNRGNLWLLAQRYDEAIADYNKAIELNIAKPHVAILNRGITYEAQGQLQKAKKEYLLALEGREEWQMGLKKLQQVNDKLELRGQQ